MKKLLKSEFFRSREQCTGALFIEEKSITATKKKKKKKRKHGNINADVNPNTHIEHEKRE